MGMLLYYLFKSPFGGLLVLAGLLVILTMVGDDISEDKSGPNPSIDSPADARSPKSPKSG